MSASPFHSLPAELAERILLFCEPRDVANFAATCQGAYKLVYESDDQFLWRELFLSHSFDDLRNALPLTGPSKPVTEHDWRTELQRRVHAKHVVLRGITGPARQRALETLVNVVETALPAKDGHDSSDKSNNLQWLEAIMREAKFETGGMSSAERQLLGRLKTYVALSYESDEIDEPTRRLWNELRRTSRCYVYDSRRYEEDTLWGPFSLREDGELVVNWEHMEHVVTVVAMKLREIPLIALRLYNKPQPGLAATRAYSAPPVQDRKPHDWAGVAGTWRRFVCFMDYRDLFAFNSGFSLTARRDPSFFEDDYQEAIRPVELHLEVLDPSVSVPASSRICISSSSSSSYYPSTSSLHPSYPPIFFKGFSRGAHSSDASVEGSVTMLADGGIRWSFVTKYDGLTQWSAEGVQVGNVCSEAGVAGIWTGAFHEEADPAGPFWMWKVHQGLPAGFQP
ncbi:uncharacterized protein LAESUDRAFT_759451 [Laetiporus sulphureus 93-53]|uniref:F-box domain-containing protein n=1 Tax=Laetiporus sulphureus 93-53 TaxID=1314785 RepID=A0A165E593_9APHY|nr:uncharacterized protein LAESUDRAFT_759451 [Laetiporus sulphureus 93-53]KZT06261.1 hypothetical protein LAESUDRAFT_759451 [Laetiporus sulphureus 93-53]